jgi:hypothetical protein
MASVFVSPGVFTSEQDFTTFASRIGITKLGVVGKTTKGPAFEVIKLRNSEDFYNRFGKTHENYPATYVAYSFMEQSNELYFTRILGKEGFTNSPAWLIVADFETTGTTLGSKSGTTLAVIRSKRNASGVNYLTNQNMLRINTTTGNTLGSFSLTASTGPLTAYTNSAITVSLNETRADYIVNSLTKNPLVVNGTPNFYVESVFPHFVREAAARGEIRGINTRLLYLTNSDYTSYSAEYTNAVTPWIVSRVAGGVVNNLFKVHTVSDGDSSNQEVKISIASLDTVNNTFDIIVRRYEDNDAASFNVLERHSKLSLNEESSRFIGKVIGTKNKLYDRKSKYIYIEMADAWPVDTVPAGFRGYELRSHITGATTVAPQIYYKLGYTTGDTINRTFLGISEQAYTSITQSVVGVKNSAKNVEHDLFQYQGSVTATGLTTTLGFHLENVAPASEYATGSISSVTGYTNTAGSLERSRLKFTVLPYGGFDGWNKYRTYANLYDEFTDAYASNVQAFKDALDTMRSSQFVDINLLATPGVDFLNNESIIKYGLNMVEDRADLLYIMDSPRISTSIEDGTPEEVVAALEDTGIDSSYATTYWPWLWVQDVNTTKYVPVAPTMAAVRAMAFTDNKYQAWFAPAGILRGIMPSNVVKADIKLDRTQMDTLYEARINPIATIAQQGVTIWGQKTLQVKESALDRINVRRLMLRIQSLVAAASLALVFEPNDQTLRDQFLAKVEPILLQIQNQRGIYAFRAIMDDTNNTPESIDRNQLFGKIQIKPTKVAEYIDITFELFPTGASFDAV